MQEKKNFIMKFNSLEERDKFISEKLPDQDRVGKYKTNNRITISLTEEEYLDLIKDNGTLEIFREIKYHTC